MLWTLLGLHLLMIAGLGWIAWRQRQQSFDQVSEYAALHQRGMETQRSVLAALESYHESQADLLRAILTVLKTPAPEHPLTGTTFLPSDAQAVELERLIKATEDRTVQSGPTAFSPDLSRPSPNRSGKVSSIRAARSSGGR